MFPWFRVSGAPAWWCDTVLGSEWVGPLLGGVTQSLVQSEWALAWWCDIVLGSEWVGPSLVVWHSPWFRVSGAPAWWCDTVLGSEWVGPLLGGVTVRPPWQQSQYGNDNLPWPLWEDDKSSRSYYPWFQEVVVKCWIHKGLKYSRQSVNLGGLWNHVSSFCAQVLVPLITLKYLCIM